VDGFTFEEYGNKYRHESTCLHHYLVEEKELGVCFLGEGIELGSRAVCEELPQPAGRGDFHIHVVALQLPLLLICSY